MTLDFNIQYCLIKKETIGTDLFYGAGNIWNAEPLFNNVSSDLYLNDFKFPVNSPLFGSANNVLFPTVGSVNIEGLASGNIGAY